MWKHFSLTIIPAILLALANPVMAETSPTETIRVAVDEILALLRDDQLDKDTRRDRMRAIIDARFDFRAMSQRTLAVNWKKASGAEQQQFVDLFTQLIENSYVGKIEAYTNETVEYPAEKVKGRKAVVDTLIVTSSKEIPIDYRVYLKDDQWYVYDVIIEGVSLISNYRSSYQEIVNREGFSGLLARMEEKIRELDSPSAGDGNDPEGTSPS
jgi:phospholipid transport system substrate-binding protein